MRVDTRYDYCSVPKFIERNTKGLVKVHGRTAAAQTCKTTPRTLANNFQPTTKDHETHVLAYRDFAAGRSRDIAVAHPENLIRWYLASGHVERFHARCQKDQEFWRRGFLSLCEDDRRRYQKQLLRGAADPAAYHGYIRDMVRCGQLSDLTYMSMRTCGDICFYYREFGRGPLARRVLKRALRIATKHDEVAIVYLVRAAAIEAYDAGLVCTCVNHTEDAGLFAVQLRALGVRFVGAWDSSFLISCLAACVKHADGSRIPHARCICRVFDVFDSAGQEMHDELTSLACMHGNLTALKYFFPCGKDPGIDIKTFVQRSNVEALEYLHKHVDIAPLVMRLRSGKARCGIYTSMTPHTYDYLVQRAAPYAPVVLQIHYAMLKQIVYGNNVELLSHLVACYNAGLAARESGCPSSVEVLKLARAAAKAARRQLLGMIHKANPWVLDDVALRQRAMESDDVVLVRWIFAQPTASTWLNKVTILKTLVETCTHTMLDFFFNMYAESVQAIELRVLHAALCHALDKRRLLHAEILAQQWCCSDSHPVLRVQITRPVPKFYADVMARYNVQIDTLPGLLLDE